ncbi:hypothetical protein Mal15_68130 [Stieleria maiorica]|uniref:Uncharacterized protein n=1 Tax=Stieleria maiorica TaxID=2795974 RepID=A0A5B9MMR3_9BACT|nr:hypothetical protein [Stieleria maiorica]QEG02692.1 hypothetical protein Mal15_68130 [Stieleria maiorica]
MGTADAQAQTPAASTAATANTSWNLRWRKSPKVTPPPAPVTQRDVFSTPPRHTPAHAATAASPAPPANPAPASGVAQVAQVAHHQAVANPMRSQPTSSHQQANAFQQAAVSRTIRQAQLSRQSQDFQDIGQVRQTQYSAPNTAAPVGNYRRAAAAPQRAPERLAQANDFFNNPFADGLNAPAQASAAQSPAAQSAPAARVALQQRRPGATAQLAIAPQTSGDDSAPGLTLPDLPGAAPQGNAAGTPAPAPEQLPPNALRGVGPDTQSLPAPSLPTPDDGSSMRDLLSDPDQQVIPEPSIDAPADQSSAQPPSIPQLNDPAVQPGDVPTDSPSDRVPTDGGQPDSYLYENPFDQNRTQREQNGRTDQAPIGRIPGDTSMLKANQLSCEDFRARIASETIDKISLDPSPPFRPDLFDPADYQRQREKFESRQTNRPWSNIDGSVIANGRFIGLAYEQVIIETEDGTQQELQVNQLSEGDLGYLSENWGLPKECLIAKVDYTPRSWAPLTMTWKASNLCSKPRYFEQVNLERYGHTAGPWLQPVVSSAHFFANIAVLPYKMGIHPPNECQYALGYYRPGNCAPWIVPPVPISARGALVQGAAMTGAFWLIP